MEFCSFKGVQGSIGYGMSYLSDFFMYITALYMGGLTNHLGSVDVYNRVGLNL